MLVQAVVPVVEILLCLPDVVRPVLRVRLTLLEVMLSPVLEAASASPVVFLL
jgi:hypothetical protein